MTPSEKFVSELCKSSFLPFWSFPNPKNKGDKELCDILVICDPDIIIISVKDINIKRSGSLETDFKRWYDRAIKSSVNQIHGAERVIQFKDYVILQDNATAIKLPLKEHRNIYRIAVTFGGNSKYPIIQGDLNDKGFVHVFDEITFNIVLKELDTISDFVNYLRLKEQFLSSHIELSNVLDENLLAFYLQNERSFLVDEPGADFIHIDSNLWEDYSNSSEYKNDKEELGISYFWDKIITQLYEDFTDGKLINKNSQEDMEIALRIMNKESRFDRMKLSKIFLELLLPQTKNIVKARFSKLDTVGSPIYVFMGMSSAFREERKEELAHRCLAARSLYEEKLKVIGIATDKMTEEKGFSIDLFYLDIPELPTELKETAKIIREELGYFNRPKIYRMKE